MNGKMRKLTAAVLLITMVAAMMTGCGGNSGNDEKANLKNVEKNGIQMEDYLTLSVEGYDGSAKLYAEIDLEQLYEDASQFLIEDVNELPFVRPRCDTVKDYLNDAFNHLDTYDLVDCEKVENLSNGDKLEVYVALPDGLEHMVTVEATPSIVNYTVKDLEKFEGINPFEFVTFHKDGFEVIDGEIGFKLHNSASMTIRLPEGNTGYMEGIVDVQEGKVYKRTDTVHITLNPEYSQKYMNEYGSDIFTCTETDMTLENVRYLPVGDYATDVFTHMGEQCMEKVIIATQEMMNQYTGTETNVENVGMMFFFDNEDVLEENGYDKYYNQIVFVNKITNDTCPDGWYTYMAYNSPVGVGYELNTDTFEITSCVGHIGGFCLEKDYKRYSNEAMDYYKGEYPTTFDCNGVAYPGHRDLSEVFEAMRTNVQILDEYDHLIVTESLKNYVQEY